MRIITWDIGGANIKRLLIDFSKDELQSEIFYFPMWQRKKSLKNFLREKNMPADNVGITMTAELCDVFKTKEEGVRYVVESCEKIFEDPYYLTVDGELLRNDEIDEPLSLAASNWVASLYYLEKRFNRGILLDIGSTTTDIVPFGYPHVRRSLKKATDLVRLQRGYMVYTGFLRTPLAAIARRVPFQGRLTRLASENFAISADIYNILGFLEDYRCDTPDGKGKTTVDSMRRIARMLCADLKEVGEQEVIRISEYLFERQAAEIAEAMLEMIRSQGLDDPVVYACGTGITLGMKACEKAGLSAKSLADTTPAHENLPCLGLAYMLKDVKAE